MRQVSLFMICIILAGCSGFGDSRLNPANWFGQAESEEADTYAEPTDPALLDERPLIAQVTEVQLDKTLGGAILRVVGIAPTQGFFGAELVPLFAERPVNGELVYFFRVEAPEQPMPQGAPRSRQISVARFIPDGVLSSARQVVVRGQLNQMRSRR